MRRNGATLPLPGPVPAGFSHPEVFAVLFALSFLAARFLPLLELDYLCPFKALSGLPCASCGMTHAFVHLAHGELGAALSASPLGALLAAAGWLFVVLDASRLLLALPFPRVGPGTARLLARGGLVAVLANWAFLLAARP